MEAKASFAKPGTEMDQSTARRVFNQWLLKEKICSLADAQALYDRLFNSETTNAQAFHTFLDYCASSFSLFGLKLQLRSIIDDRDKSEYIAICNTVSDRIAQIATDFTSIEIKHFRSMLQALKSVNGHELHIHSIAQHLGLSRPQAQNLLNSFIEREWMDQNSDTGKFRLGPRAILELDSVLQDADADADEEKQNDTAKFETCSLCKDLIIRGTEYFCAVQECSQTFHQFCLFNYRESVQKQECPGCKSESSLISKSDHVDMQHSYVNTQVNDE